MLASVKYMSWQNVGTDKIFAAAKFRRPQNVGVHKILASTKMLLTKYRRWQNFIQVQWSIFLLFWPGEVHSSWLLSDLAVALLIKVLSPPCVVAEWLATASRSAYMDVLPPALSWPGCTGPPCQKVTNIAVNKNIGTRQDFADFCQTLAVNISPSMCPIKKS